MKTHEFKVVRVPASMRKQTKALNKYAEKGWEVIDTKHLMGAGVTTVHLRRAIEPKATPAVTSASPSVANNPNRPTKPARKSAKETNAMSFRELMAYMAGQFKKQ